MLEAERNAELANKKKLAEQEQQKTELENAKKMEEETNLKIVSLVEKLLEDKEAKKTKEDQPQTVVVEQAQPEPKKSSWWNFFRR